VGTFALAGMPTSTHHGRMLFVTGILSGATLVLLAFAKQWPTALAAAALVGGAQAMFMALTNTFLQVATPDHVRGRVLSVYLMVGGGVMAFANLATGRLADAYGVTPVLAIPALAFVLVVVLSALGPSLRGMYLRRTAPAAAR
jgi:MFS family permease